jgi:pimeloyl-ACP methyl ester carboxylesterase
MACRAYAVEASRLTIGRFADNVIAAADMLQVEELVLMGHSMGGPVAIEAALGLAGRCKFILGVDTFTDDAFYGLRPPDEIEMRVQKFEAHFEDTMIKMVRNITAPQTDPLIIAEITEVMATSNRQVALAALKSLLEWDIEARWPLLDTFIGSGRTETSKVVSGIYKRDFGHGGTMLADEGLAVVVISPYLPEIMNLSDRILACRQGRVVEEFSLAESTEEKIMCAAVH